MRIKWIEILFSVLTAKDIFFACPNININEFVSRVQRSLRSKFFVSSFRNVVEVFFFCLYFPFLFPLFFFFDAV